VLTEEKLIPYHATDLTGRRALVFAPHPDDETIGCGGSLALHVKVGDPVKVVFLTNGALGDMSGEMAKGDYVAVRRKEAEKACASLGVENLEFWAYEDRSLAGSRGALRQVMDLLEDFRPDLVYCPSPLEIHPDHRATCFLVCDAIRGCDKDFDVAFYEIGQPISVNTLVDITGVMDLKRDAFSAYKSQLKERPFDDVCLALSRFRCMTLPEGATHAEGFSMWGTGVIRKVGPLSIPFQKTHRLAPTRREAGPLVSVIVRTRDRPALLANALKSVAAQTYSNLEIVVVNDGGQDVKDVVTALAGNIPVVYVNHEKSKGRSAAANSGFETAHGSYLNFLDDDDLIYPDHVETLVSFLQAKGGKVAYSSVLNVYFHGPPDTLENRSKEELIFDFDFDPDRILFENYIPVMSVLFSRDILSRVEGFCEDLDLFEDWDFWVRASRHFTFHHVDKVTAEYRFYGNTAMEGSHRDKYRYDEALVKMFNRNRPYLTGKAWVNFQNNGFAGALRREAWEREAHLKATEDDLLRQKEYLQKSGKDVKDYQAVVLQKEGTLYDLKEKYDALLGHRDELRRDYSECQEVLRRIQGHMGFRTYRKIKGLLRTIAGIKGHG